VLGESRNSLIGKQLRKAALTALVAFGIAILVVHLVASSSLASYVSGSLNVADNVGIIAFMLAIVVVAAIVAGIAPAIYSTSQPTTMVLKGSYAMSVKGKALRNVLVGLQYVLSFGFILMALFVHIQTKYMIHSDMGFTQANVLQIYCGNKAGGDHEAVTAKLLQNPAIADVTFADGNLVSDQKMGWSRNDGNGDNIYMEVFPVDVNFVKFFGLDIVDGRDFSESDNQSDAGCFIVNENFIQTFPQFEVGKLLNAHTENPAEIIGVMKDFNFKSLQHPMEPLVLFNWGKNIWRPFRVMYVKTVAGADYESVSQYIKETVNAFDPTMPISQIDVHHLDQWIEDMYQSEEKLGNLITIASLVALIIAIIGIIGLVFFETQFLSREIAIRRVNGASVDSILRMINRKYIIMAVASFVVATPLTYMVITTWRSEFAYQAPVSAWIFAVAFALVVAITVAVVTLQSWRAASANPVEALKEN
jgi:putative ABC transport system permease protein